MATKSYILQNVNIKWVLMVFDGIIIRKYDDFVNVYLLSLSLRAATAHGTKQNNITA